MKRLDLATVATCHDCAPGLGSIQKRASFAHIRYANCWEDANVLVQGLAPLEGARCLSIASAGDNTLSLVARGAASVIAVDLSPAQLALVELKMTAFRRLSYEELLGFLGVRASARRQQLYRELRPSLGDVARAFWDARPQVIERGVIHGGRLEGYFRIFRRYVLPLVHSRSTVGALLQPKSLEERCRFYEEAWDSWRWRALVRLFFGRCLMGRLGRDPEFLRYAPGDVGATILERARRALTEQPTDENPYLDYILTGAFGPVLPDYLRPEHHAAIRQGLDGVRLRLGPIEDMVAGLAPHSVDVFNLSDIAEYMDVPGYHRLLERLRVVAAPGARLAYWNLLAPRRRPDSMRDWLDARQEKASLLHAEARAFFYGAFVLEVAR